MSPPASASPGSSSAGTRLLLLASVVIWGWTFVAMKVLLAHVAAFELVGLRFAIGLPVLVILLHARRIPLGFERRDLPALSLGAAILAFHFLIQPIALSLEHSTATNTGWIISFSPLGIVLLSRIHLGERLAPRQLLGIGLATLGVLLLVSKGDPANLSWLESKGDAIILVSSFTWALYTVVTRDLSRRRSPLAVTLVVFTPLCLACLAVMILRSDLPRLASMPLVAWVALLFLGVLGTLAQWFWQIGVARLGASRAGVYVYLEPLATTVLAVPLLGEAFGVAGALGGGLLLLGVWLGQRGTEPRSVRASGASEG